MENSYSYQFNIYCIIQSPGEIPDSVEDSFYVQLRAEDIFEADQKVSDILSNLEKELNRRLDTKLGVNYLYLQSIGIHEDEEGIKKLSEKWGRKYAVIKSNDLSFSTLIEEIAYLKNFIDQNEKYDGTQQKQINSRLMAKIRQKRDKEFAKMQKN